MSAETACLLLHGFGGSPFEMEPLVPVLEGLGCAVDLPTLPGHDSTPEEFRRTFFKDWLGHAEERYLALSGRHKKVIPIGFSMGGSLALILAARHASAGVISLAAPVRLHPFSSHSLKSAWLLFLPLIKHVRPVLPRRRSRPESRVIAPYRGYEGASYLPQLHSLGKGLAELRALLPELRCPALIMHDARDGSSWAGSALTIARQAASEDLTLIYTQIKERITSHHMLPTHQETRALVAAEVSKFVARMQSEN